MTNYRSDIAEMMDIEKKQRQFYIDEQVRLFGKTTVTDVRVDLILKNKNCKKAVGMRAFKASQFVRFEKNAMVFKREMDDEETVIKNCWIKNYDDVYAFVKGAK